MGRVTITFGKETLQQFQNSALDKKVPVSEYLRRLIVLGSQLEAVAENSNPNSEDKRSNLKALWKNDLSWLLESLYLLRYLTRYLIDSPNMPSKNADYTNELINKAREKAEAYVNELLIDHK